MKKGILLRILICVLVTCCVYVHRRVIRALLGHKPMPEAPKWHVWCGNRRS